MASLFSASVTHPAPRCPPAPSPFLLPGEAERARNTPGPRLCPWGGESLTWAQPFPSCLSYQPSSWREVLPFCKPGIELTQVLCLGFGFVPTAGGKGSQPGWRWGRGGQQHHTQPLTFKIQRAPLTLAAHCGLPAAMPIPLHPPSLSWGARRD